MLRLARFALRFPRLCVTFSLLVTAVCCWGLLRLEMRTDGAALHPPSNPLVMQSALDRDVFQDAELLILVVEQRPRGPAVSSPEGLLFLRELDRALRRLPGIRSTGVRSLASLQEIRVTAGSLSADPFLDHVPTDPGAFAQRLRSIRRHPLAGGLFLSGDGAVAAVYLPVLEGVRHQTVLADAEKFLGTLKGAPFKLRLTGPLVAEARLGDAVLADLARLIPLMVAVLTVVFFILLRSPGALVVLSAEVAGVLIWTLGAMGLFGVPISLVTALLPVLLMVIAITDEVHLLERLQGKLADALAASPEPAISRPVLRESLLSAIAELERPTLFAALTTALGFFAFPFTSIVPLQHFGLFSTLGLLIAVTLSFSMVPALMVLLPARWFLPVRPFRLETAGRRLLPYEKWLVANGRRGLVLGVLVLLLALPGLFRLKVGDNWIANFDPASDLVATERALNRSLWGSYRFDVVLEGPAGLFYAPRGVSLVQDMARLAGQAPGVSGVVTHLVPLREVATAFGERADLRTLPRDRMEDLLTLAMMSEDPLGMSSWVSAAGDKARIQLFLKGEDYRRDQKLTEDLDRALGGRLRGTGVSYHFSGDVPTGLEMVRVIVLNQLRSIGLTFLSTAVLLLVVERSLRTTLAVMLPVTAASLLVFAGMGYGGVSLGVATSMFGSLTLGVGIDFSLHFLHSYQRERERTGEHGLALAHTFANTGKALRWSVMVLALGFLVLTLSDLRPNHSLGVLLAAAMLASYGMTLLLLPGLAGWIYRGRRSKVPAALVLWLGGCLLGGIASASPAVSPAPAPTADAVMREVEKRFRSVPRVIQLDIETKRPRREGVIEILAGEPVRLWGAFNGNPDRTDVLFVFTAPQRMQGTGLMIQDPWAPGSPDNMWYHMRTFRRFLEIPRTSLKVVVPGTCLTYEDARGFLSSDKYAFRFAAAPSKNPEWVIEARPRSPDLGQDLGASTLKVHVDRERHFVRKIDYFGLSGQLVKTYEVESPLRFGDLWLPGKARMKDLQSSIESVLSHQYWILKNRIPDSLFDVAVDDGPLLDRLKVFSARQGVKMELEPGAP